MDNWCYYGVASNVEEAQALLSGPQRPAFEVDIHKILVKMMASCEVIPLAAPGSVFYSG